MSPVVDLRDTSIDAVGLRRCCVITIEIHCEEGGEAEAGATLRCPTCQTDLELDGRAWGLVA